MRGTDHGADHGTGDGRRGGADRGAEFFDRIRQAGLVRPDGRRWAAGVAVGIADRLQVDPLLIRGIFVAASLFGGAGLLAYGVAWALMPQQDGRIHAQRALSGDITAGTVGATLAIIAGIGSTGPWEGRPGIGWYSPGGLVFLALIGAGLWWWYGQRGRDGGQAAGTSGHEAPGPQTGSQETPGYETPAYGTAGYGAGSTYPAAYPAPPAPAAPHTTPRTTPQVTRMPRLPDPHAPLHVITRATLGAALLAAGAVALWDRQVSDLPGAAGLLAAAVGLGVIALGVIAAGVFGRRAGALAPIGVVLAVVVVVGSLLPAVRTPSSFGDVTWRPVTAAAAETGVSRDAGQVIVDLSAPAVAGQDPADPTRVNVSVGMGELRIRVPDGTATVVDASVGVGQIDSPGSGTGNGGGFGQSERLRFGSGEPTLFVDASVGFGHIQVEQVPAVTR